MDSKLSIRRKSKYIFPRELYPPVHRTVQPVQGLNLSNSFTFHQMLRSSYQPHQTHSTPTNITTLHPRSKKAGRLILASPPLKERRRQLRVGGVTNLAMHSGTHQRTNGRNQRIYEGINEGMYSGTHQRRQEGMNQQPHYKTHQGVIGEREKIMPQSQFCGCMPMSPSEEVYVSPSQVITKKHFLREDKWYFCI